MSDCQNKPTLLPEALWKALMNLPALRYMKAPVNTETELYEKYPSGNEKGTFAFVHNENTFYTYYPKGWNRGRWKPISADSVSSFFDIDAEFLQEGDILVYDSNKKKFVVKSGNIWNKLIGDLKGKFSQVTKFLNQTDEIPTDNSDSGVYFVHNEQYRALYIVLGKKSIRIFNSKDYYIKEEVDSEISRIERNMVNLGIRKTYSSYGGMQNDVDNPIGDDGNPIRKGELVMVSSPEDTSKDGIYIYKILDSKKTWEYAGGLGIIEELNKKINRDDFIEDSAKYVYIIKDKDGRLLQTISTKGKAWFPKQELLVKTDSEKYLYYITDNANRIVFGILKDGSIEANIRPSKQVTQLRKEIEGFKAILMTKDSQKYVYQITDSQDRMLFGILSDGTIDGKFRIPTHIKKLWGYLQSISDTVNADYSDKYVYQVTDTDGRLLFAIQHNGKLHFPNKSLLDETRTNNIIHTITDSCGRMLMYSKPDGSVYIPKLKLSKNIFKEIDAKNALVRSNEQGILHLPFPSSLATVNIIGDLSTLNTSKNAVWAVMEYNDHSGNYLKTPVEIGWQGSSSIFNPRKNYSIDILDEDGESRKLKFGNWVVQDGFHLKAEYMDATRSRNVVCAQLTEQVYQTRPWLKQRPWRIPYSDKNASLKDRFDTGALGHIDGFFFEMYINGVYHGLYNFNLKKHRDNYQMDKSNKKHIHMEMAGGDTFIKYPVQWDGWEIRNPKGFDVQTEPASGEVKTSIERFQQWAANVTEATFRSDCDEYLHMDFFIDFHLIKFVINGLDMDRNNVQLCTWDGKRWSFLLYDMDTTFGLINLGTALVNGTDISSDLGNIQNVEKVMNKVFASEIQSRYKELRDKGILSAENIVNLFNNRLKQAGIDALERDLKKWNETPSNRPSGTYPNTPANGGCYTGIDQIETWITERIQALDSKYNY